MIFEKLKSAFSKQAVAIATAASVVLSAGAAAAQPPQNSSPAQTAASSAGTTTAFNATNENPGAAVAPNTPESSPTILRQAGDYSEQHPVVTIAIAKGKKDDKLTGEQIGQVLSQRLQRLDVPSKYFITEGDDYTTVAFFVAGRLYGGYGLNDSLMAIVHVSSDYEVAVRPYIATWPEREKPASGTIASRSPVGLD